MNYGFLWLVAASIYSFLRCVSAVQCVCGMSDAASAGEAGDQEGEPSSGWDRPGGGVQGPGPQAPEGGVREHEEVHDLPVQQARAGSDGTSLCVKMYCIHSSFDHIEFNVCFVEYLSLGDLQFAERKGGGQAALWQHGERKAEDGETARGHIYTGTQTLRAFTC